MMSKDSYSVSDDDEARLSESLKNDVEDFLASASELDFVFDISERTKPYLGSFCETLFNRESRPRAIHGVKVSAVSLALLLSFVTALSCAFFLISSTNQSKDFAVSKENVVKTTIEDISPISAPVQNKSRSDSSNLYGYGVEMLESFSEKCLGEESEVALGIVDFWGIGQKLSDYTLFSSETIELEKSGADGISEETSRGQKTFSSQEIVLSALSVSALVFTIEKYYNDEQAIKEIEMLN